MSGIKTWGEVAIMLTLSFAFAQPVTELTLDPLFLPMMFAVGVGMYVFGIVEDYSPGDSL